MYKTFTSFVENNQSIDENFIMDYINSELNNRNLEKYNNLISSKSTKFSIDKIKNNHIQGLEDYTKPQIKNITTCLKLYSNI